MTSVPRAAPRQADGRRLMGAWFYLGWAGINQARIGGWVEGDREPCRDAVDTGGRITHSLARMVCRGSAAAAAAAAAVAMRAGFGGGLHADAAARGGAAPAARAAAAGSALPPPAGAAGWDVCLFVLLFLC